MVGNPRVAAPHIRCCPLCSPSDDNIQGEAPRWVGPHARCVRSFSARKSTMLAVPVRLVGSSIWILKSQTINTFALSKARVSRRAHLCSQKYWP